MDFNNGLYVFNGVPGFDVSKGERIIKALQKLQAKIKRLEHMRESEKEFSSKEVQTSKDSDITFTDVQFKLLVLQLQYMRSILRKNRPNLYATAYASENVVETSPAMHDIDNQNKETQTGISLLFESDPQDNGVENVPKTLNQNRNAATQDMTPLDSNVKIQYNKSPNKNIPHPSVLKESQQHYHLKFDDVPFILGASSSASHNVVANVQNIIAMMKTHNKNLCGPRLHTRSNSTSIKNCNQDANKILKKLSEELSELQAKQERLKERFDTAQCGSHFADTKITSAPTAASISETSKKDVKKAEVINPGAHTSINRNARKIDHPKFKKREVAKQEKHAVPFNRIQENLSQMSRQRLLRSLQDFKTHLTEEDISWE